MMPFICSSAGVAGNDDATFDLGAPASPPSTTRLNVVFLETPAQFDSRILKEPVPWITVHDLSVNYGNLKTKYCNLPEAYSKTCS